MSNHWIVELHQPASGEDADVVANAIARQFGFQHRGKVRHRNDDAKAGNDEERFFHMVESKSPAHRMKRSLEARKKQLEGHPKVKLAVQQKAHVRRKRGFRYERIGENWRNVRK